MQKARKWQYLGEIRFFMLFLQENLDFSPKARFSSENQAEISSCYVN